GAGVPARRSQEGARAGGAAGSFSRVKDFRTERGKPEVPAKDTVPSPALRAGRRGMSPALHILYEDNHCLAVSKPAPLLPQGVPAGIDTLEARVKAYLKERYHKPGNVYLGIPHRLDRPVSGVVLFARNTKAARRLAEQFQQRQVRKRYWVAVEG